MGRGIIKVIIPIKLILSAVIEVIVGHHRIVGTVRLLRSGLSREILNMKNLQLNDRKFYRILRSLTFH